MTSYRLYQVSDSHIIGWSGIDATNDEAALIYAQSHIHFDSVEIWEGSRMVGALGGASPGPQNPPDAAT
jgi:hypothetical protein